MKRIILLAIVIPIQAAAGSLYAQNGNKDFQSLYSIVGTWSLETKKGVLFESWSQTNDSTLSSISYRVNGTDTILLEKVQLVCRGNKIMYIPVVENQNDRKPVIFTMSSREKGKFIFENPYHDFPQRIIYNLPADNILLAWIEGDRMGHLVKSEYKFRRVASRK